MWRVQVQQTLSLLYSFLQPLQEVPQWVVSARLPFERRSIWWAHQEQGAPQNKEKLGQKLVPDRVDESWKLTDRVLGDDKKCQPSRQLIAHLLCGRSRVTPGGGHCHRQIVVEGWRFGGVPAVSYQSKLDYLSERSPLILRPHRVRAVQGPGGFLQFQQYFQILQGKERWCAAGDPSDLLADSHSISKVTVWDNLRSGTKADEELDRRERVIWRKVKEVPGSGGQLSVADRRREYLEWCRDIQVICIANL